MYSTGLFVLQSKVCYNSKYFNYAFIKEMELDKSMKILKQVSLILGICLVGEALVAILPFAFPSSVMAILLLAVLLIGKVIKEKQIKETADFLLSNMALVFVPLSVGMIEELGVLKGQAMGFIIVVCVSLIITFLGTYVSVRLVQKCMGKLRKTEEAGHE